MKQERLLDLEQQKRFLTHINYELKNKVGVLENQKEVLVEVLQRGVTSKPSVKTSLKKPSFKIHYALIVFILIISTVAVSFYLLGDSKETGVPLKTRYLTENLRGDTVDTWKLWKIDSQGILVVNIANADLVDKNKIDVIKEAILSDETIAIDDFLTHKGLPGSVSTYFMGWQGALNDASEANTQYHVPTKFRVIESDDGVGDIIITLSTSKDQDGYSGYTKSTVEGNQILKSQITIYDVDSLSDGMLAAIIRHEFGHAIGLGHSTAPEDLMAQDISMQIPYISECDVSAVSNLYDGTAMSNTACEK